MSFLEGLPLWANIAIFSGGAVVVWTAGTRLSRGADAIAARTGMGQAFVGALLLGGTTSLPEIAATISASLIRNAPIAVNNIFGGIAMQVTILAMADAAGRGALTGRNRQAGVLLEGVLLIFVLNAAVVAIAVGDIAIFGVGVWSAAIAALVVIGLLLIKHYEVDPRWKPAQDMKRTPDDEKTARAIERRERFRSLKTPALVMQMTLASLAVLAGGFAIARTGEQIAAQTGIGASFVGAILIAFATSLPEVSTTLEAVRLGARVMAISNIFGTNLFDSGLLFVADIFYPGAPVLNEVGRFAQVGALLGIACTAIYLAGILERSDRTLMRLGLDSILVLLTYAGGVVVLYMIR